MASMNLIFFTMLIVALSSAAPPSGNKHFDLEVPEACKGKDICMIKPKNYEKVEQRIRELMKIHVHTEVQERRGEPKKYTSKPEDWINCPYRYEEGEPYLMNSTNGGMSILVQSDPLPQTVRTRKCLRDVIQRITTNDQECYQGAKLADYGLSTSCKQITAFRHLYVYDEHQDVIKLKGFEVPVFCSCKVTRRDTLYE